MNTTDDFFGDVISAFTRKQAIEDGFQVKFDPKTSKAAGILHPVYFTRSVWDRYVEVPEGMTGFQDKEGRLWDILWMFYLSARRTPSSMMQFSFHVQLPDDGIWPENECIASKAESKTMRQVRLASIIGPLDIDDPSPAITIMLPGED
jgi:hypothetical protein